MKTFFKLVAGMLVGAVVTYAVMTGKKFDTDVTGGQKDTLQNSPELKEALNSAGGLDKLPNSPSKMIALTADFHDGLEAIRKLTGNAFTLKTDTRWSTEEIIEFRTNIETDITNEEKLKKDCTLGFNVVAPVQNKDGTWTKTTYVMSYITPDTNGWNRSFDYENELRHKTSFITDDKKEVYKAFAAFLKAKGLLPKEPQQTTTSKKSGPALRN